MYLSSLQLDPRIILLVGAQYVKNRYLAWIQCMHGSKPPLPYESTTVAATYAIVAEHFAENRLDRPSIPHNMRQKHPPQLPERMIA